MPDTHSKSQKRQSESSKIPQVHLRLFLRPVFVRLSERMLNSQTLRCNFVFMKTSRNRAKFAKCAIWESFFLTFHPIF